MRSTKYEIRNTKYGEWSLGLEFGFEKNGSLKTHFFQPALERYLAYMRPMSPIPMRPMAGCSDAGPVGETVWLFIATTISVGDFAMEVASSS